MARRKYYVDWADPDYPDILVHSFDVSDPYAPIPMTLTEAKQEIIERFQNIIHDARAQIARTRELRASEIN